ncbi:GNAT family N-acetyltransferase [Cellulosilyticum sp. I15G10I2]|uniref:GNAT family N-acetyltransferase n=1 Tax=Cellulosilyticum sp. I15G10I2 TaxID=1892843 RepID=UPI00085CC8CE|nr:GNAT family N-acetyltransferase [Cellulosilyticum sp. I15G10I2]
MNINFRRAVIEDIDKLIEVQNRSFYEDYIKYNECPSYNESKEDMFNYISNCIVYVIECNCEIVGDIIIREIDEENYYLRVLCVVPEFHNLGIGQKAIEVIEKDTPKVKKWELITPFESVRNHYFYEKMGYIKVGEYKHSDILTMFKYAKEIK